MSSCVTHIWKICKDKGTKQIRLIRQKDLIKFKTKLQIAQSASPKTLSHSLSAHQVDWNRLVPWFSVTFKQPCPHSGVGTWTLRNCDPPRLHLYCHSGWTSRFHLKASQRSRKKRVLLSFGVVFKLSIHIKGVWRPVRHLHTTCVLRNYGNQPISQ